MWTLCILLGKSTYTLYEWSFYLYNFVIGRDDGSKVDSHNLQKWISASLSNFVGYIAFINAVSIICLPKGILNQSEIVVIFMPSMNKKKPKMNRFNNTFTIVHQQKEKD